MQCRLVLVDSGEGRMSAAERCPRGHFMAEVADYAFEGYVEGAHFECHAPDCVKADSDAESAYWAGFDVDAFRRAFDEAEPQPEEVFAVRRWGADA
jgi:hypothetical protein